MGRTEKVPYRLESAQRGRHRPEYGFGERMLDASQGDFREREYGG